MHKKKKGNKYPTITKSISNPLIWLEKGCICTRRLTYCLNSRESLLQPKSQMNLCSSLSYVPKVRPFRTEAQNRCSRPAFMRINQDSSHEQMFLCTHCLFMQNCPEHWTAPLCSHKYLSQHFKHCKVAASNSECGVLPQPLDALRRFSVRQESAP